MCIGGFDQTDPEVTLAKCFKDDLGVDINPQALRMFIRMRWDRVSVLAHAIHGTVPNVIKKKYTAAELREMGWPTS